MNTKNVYLKNVLFSLATDEKEKRKIENDLKKKNREREAKMQENTEGCGNLCYQISLYG